MNLTITYLCLLACSGLLFSMTEIGRLLMSFKAYWISYTISAAITYSIFAYFDALALLNVLTGIGIIINAIGVKFIWKRERWTSEQ
jgi:hypothetical protein